jgi:hypothetical protein
MKLDLITSIRGAASPGPSMSMLCAAIVLEHVIDTVHDPINNLLYYEVVFPLRTSLLYEGD